MASELHYKAMYERICVACGKVFQTGRVQSKCCSADCSETHRQNWRKAHHQSPHEKKVLVDTKKKKYKSPVSEAQQAKIDKDYMQKHRIVLEQKIYEKGTPEWDQVCAQITPLHMIKRTTLTKGGFR